MNKKIIVDVDDVLIPTLHELVKLWNLDHGDNFSAEDVLSWGIDTYREGASEYFAKIDFENIEQKNNSIHWMKKLHSLGYELIIATASREDTFNMKIKWINSNLPFIPNKNILRLSDKSIIEAFAMIDDGVHNLETANVKHKFLYDMPHNKNRGEFIRVRSIGDVYRFLEKLEES